MKIYFISGLGADERIFKNISLPDSYTPVHIPWIRHNRNESLPDYAHRLASMIDTKEKFALIGLSFGGMIATEIANRLKVEKTILISSIPSVQQLPYYYKLAGKLRLHRVLPISMIKHAALLKRFFAPETSEDKIMLRGMIRDCDPDFIRWALHAIITWKNHLVPDHFIHIHGRKDGILPLMYAKPTHLINGGGHLMILNRAREINKVLNEVLST